MNIYCNLPIQMMNESYSTALSSLSIISPIPFAHPKPYPLPKSSQSLTLHGFPASHKQFTFTVAVDFRQHFIKPRQCVNTFTRVTLHRGSGDRRGKLNMCRVVKTRPINTAALFAQGGVVLVGPCPLTNTKEIV